MKRGFSAMEVIIYGLIVIVILIAAIYFVSKNWKSLSDGFFNILGSFK